MSLKSEPLYPPVLCVSLSTLYLSDKDGRLVFISLQKFLSSNFSNEYSWKGKYAPCAE